MLFLSLLIFQGDSAGARSVFYHKEASLPTEKILNNWLKGINS
jgi:hypothetical protein